jgi:hypothetical protein
MALVPFLRGVTVAGISFRTPAERAIALGMQAGWKLTLVPEPENAHDPLAIKVLSDGTHIGYIPRDCAGAVAFVLANGGEYE